MWALVITALFFLFCIAACVYIYRISIRPALVIILEKKLLEGCYNAVPTEETPND
jgi:hypothetical protein